MRYITEDDYKSEQAEREEADLEADQKRRESEALATANWIKKHKIQHGEYYWLTLPVRNGFGLICGYRYTIGQWDDNGHFLIIGSDHWHLPGEFVDCIPVQPRKRVKQ